MKLQKLFLLAVTFLGISNAYGLAIYGTDMVDVTGAESDVTAFDSSVVNIEQGSDVAYIYGLDNSTINVNGGTISWLELYGSSQANISSSEPLAWLKLYENSTANISFISDLSWLIVGDDSVVNIFGTDFSYSNGHLSGIWGNGLSFSFWALEDSDHRAGTGGEFIPDNIVLHEVSVPEPSTLAILVLGFIAIGFRKFRGNKA